VDIEIHKIQGAHIIFRFTGEDAEEYVRMFNLLPPASEWVADTVVIYGAPSRANYFQFFFKDNCAVSFGGVSKDTVAFLTKGKTKGVAF